MDIVTIDFETYYDKEYSLSKLTTEKYIRDPRFEIIGVGVKVNDHPADWYSGDNVGRFLKSLDYSKRAILCHNTVFDGAILSWLFGIKPKLWLDTLSMARPHHNITVGGSLGTLVEYYRLGTKGTEVTSAICKHRKDFTPAELSLYAAYCLNDVELTYKLFNAIRTQCKPVEILVIDQVIRMYTEPCIVLDTELLQEHLEAVRKAKTDLMDALPITMGNPHYLTREEIQKTLMSDDMFSDALRNLNVDPPVKTSPRTGRMNWAFSKTDREFLALQEHEDPRVQALVSARLGVRSTIEETRTEALIGVAKRGALPIMLNYYGAHTGRFSGGDKLNLQNLPSRSGNTIRRALRAPKDHVLIACDSAQIEARIVAWLAGQADLLDAFRDSRDVYSEFASDIYGFTVTKKNVSERFVGKTCILGLGYGMGSEKLRRTLALGQNGIKVDLPMEDCIRITEIYRNKYCMIPRLWNECNCILYNIMSGGDGYISNVLPYSAEGIHLPSGYRLTYPGLRRKLQGYQYISDARQFRKYVKSKITKDEEGIDWTHIYGGKVVENIVQALASIVIREQMAKCRLLGLRVVLQVHDEIVICSRAEDAEADMEKLVSVMSTPPEWAPDLPVACEAGYADNYGDT